MALDANINRIKFLRSKTAGVVPTAAVLDEGELAINLVDRTIYSKNGTNVVELGFGKGGSVSGAITAPQFNGPLVGNASTATTLQTPRTINGTSFNGSSNITFNNVVPNDNRLIKPVDSIKAAISTYFTSKGGLTSSTVDASYGDLIALNGYSDISGGKVNALFFNKTSKEIVHYQAEQTATSWGQSHVLAYTTDNVASATVLQTTRTINGTSFNGSVNITTANWGAPRTLTVGNIGKSVNGSANVSWSIDEIGAVNKSGDTMTGSLNINSDSSAIRFGNNADIGFIKQGGAPGKMIVGNSNPFEILKSSTPTIPDVIPTKTAETFPVLLSLSTSGVLTTAGGFDGNAATATALQTARSINGVSFNGTSDINIQHVAVRIPGNSNLNNYQTPGIYYCDADAEATSTVNTPVNLSYSLVVTSAAGIVQTFTAYNGGNNDVYVRGFYASSWSQWKKLAFTNDSITGNAGSATKLQTARSIGITGSGASGSISFDGSANVNIPLDVATQATATNNTTIATTAFVQAVNIADTGSSATSLKLKTARTIGGVLFDGSANINLPGVNTAGNQSTTGNAATATSAAKWTTARTLTIGDSGKSVDGSGNVSWTRLDMGVPRMTATTNVGIDNSESCIGYVTNTLFGELDGALYSQVYSEMCKHQIHGDYRTGQIALRGKNNGTWQAWRTVLDSGNYNNYSPTKTGTGASGSWGISITGNAETATTLATARTINGVSFNGSANITVADDTKLPLAGGTISGNLIVTSNITANGAIFASGNITAFSDRRLKENIKPIDNVIDRIKKLNGVTYTRNDLEDKERIHTGLIAQDVQHAMPESVIETENGILTVDYQSLVGLLAETIKNLNARIEKLENK